MNIYVVTYSMGGIATGGFFKSSVIARKPENIKGLLSETHGEDISNLFIRETETANSTYENEQVLTTVDA